MPGFLLADDAIGARKQVFDDWIDEQKRNAEQAAQQTAQAAQAAAQQHASEVAARASQFQDWMSQQQPVTPPVPPVAPAPPQPAAPAVAPPDAMTPTPPPAAGPALATTPEAQDRAQKFQDWVTQQTQQAVQPQPQPELGTPAQAAQQTSQAPQAPTADDPMRKAAPFLGEQYVWGGKSPQQGFDCSGFAGYLTTGQPESTTTLYGKSAAVDPSTLQSGDLVFYNMGQDDMHLQHVGVYIGNGKLVQQGGSERQVNVADVNQAVGSAPEFRRLNAGQVQQTAGAPAQAVGRGGGGGGAGGFTDQTTAGISGGGARSGQLGDQGQQILSGAADAASWLGNDGQKALQSILVTEGGLAGARGDSGRSAGPLQFFEGGQLGNFARAFQMSLEEAKTYVEQHPLEAIRWAIGVPSNPGYLGAAIVQGLQRNLSGPELATFAQRTGQVSESPERAGDNYRNLFGQGQDVVRGAGSAVDGALEAGRQVSTRAADLIGQGQQLVQQGAQGARDAWSQFDNAQSQRQADNQRWFDEQRSRMQGDVQDRLQQGQEFTQSLQDRMRQFQANAEPLNRPPLEGFTAPGGPAEQIGQRFSDLGQTLTTEPPGYRSEFGAQATPGERQQQLEQTTDIGTGGLAPDVRAALLMGRADEQVGRQTAEQMVQKAKDMGWEPDQRQERLATGVLSSLTPLNVMSMFVTGPETLTMRMLVEGATFLGLSGVGGVAGSELFPDSPIAPLVGALALPIAGPAALRGVRAGLGTPTAQAALRARQPAQAEAGFAAGIGPGRGPRVEPEVPSTRMFHGTAADFERPGRFDPEGLYGGGYYLTSDPRVAGGLGRALPERLGDFPTGQGYAMAAGWERLTQQERIAREVADVDTYIESLRNGPLSKSYTPEQASSALDWFQQERARLVGRMDVGGAGPNVRAVDVPENTRLLDMDAYVAPADREAIRQGLSEQQRAVFDRQTARAFEDRPTGQQAYDALTATFGRGPGAKDEANRILADAGFDGVRHKGGKLVPMGDESGRAIEHDVNVIFPESLDKIRNAISGRQGGQADPMMAARLGGGAAGVASQEATMSEEDKSNPLVRISRDLTGVLLGSAAPGLAVSGARGIAATARGRAPNLADLSDIRSSMARSERAGPPPPPPGSAERMDYLQGKGKFAPAEGKPMTPAELISAIGKQNLLAGIKQHVTNITSQMVELARTPARAALAGEGDQALISLRAGVHGIPDAMQEFARTWSSGISATAAPGQRTQAWLPVFRFLGATDDFFRTLGAHMGMATEAQRLVTEAGAKTPEAVQQVLQQNQQAIFNAGKREGAASVFQTMGAQGAQETASSFGRWKTGLLGSVAESPAWKDQLKAYGKQGLGLVVDAIVPFAGMPAKIWDIGLGRVPVVGEVRRFTELAMALQRRDSPAAQRALGELGMQSLTSSAILSNVFAGNVRGPDDKDHPNSVLMGDTWVDYSGWGAFQLPLAVPSSTVEAWRKVGNKVDAKELDYVTALMGAWGKTLSNSYYLNSVFDTVTTIGQGGLPSAIAKTLTNYTDRALPSGFNQVEQMIDANVREVSKEFPKSVVDRVASRIPYLATTLNTQVEQTTGGVRQREKQGPLGVLFGAETYTQPPIEREIMRLNRLGYALSPPKANPTTISVNGAQIKLGEAEQRALGQARGQQLERVLGARMQSSYWGSLTDDQKARFIDRALNQATEQNVVTWRRMTPALEQRARMARGERVVGRLTDQSEFGGFNSPSTAA